MSRFNTLGILVITIAALFLAIVLLFGGGSARPGTIIAPGPIGEPTSLTVA